MDRMPPLAFDLSILGTGHFPDAFAEINAQSSLGPAYAVDYDNNKSPHQLQYNLTLQQQIGASDVVSLAYVGSRGINLVGYLTYNEPHAVYNGRALEFPVGAIQTNPLFSNLNFFGPVGDSWYSSFQLGYQRRFSRGLQAGLSYTYGRTLSTTDVSQIANPVNSASPGGNYAWDRAASKGLSGYSIKHSLSVNYSYDLPFGRGMNGMVAKVLSGWRTTGVLSMHSGHPGQVTLGNPTVLSNIGVPGRYPNTNPAFTGDVVLGTPSDGQAKYFNREAYVYANCPSTQVGLPVGSSTLGSNCVGIRELGNLGRNTLIGPGSITWNPALFKSITLTERTNLEFRMEMFNVLNRPNYSFPAASLSNAGGIASTTAGDITSTVGSARQIQFALKLIF
jgi:hypothetical protein